MKKYLFPLIVVASLLATNYSFAEDEIVINQDLLTTQKEKIQKDIKEELKQTEEQIVLFDDEIEHEYKIIGSNYVGYYNEKENYKFITQFDDIYLMEKYLKIKKDKKYGLIDKKGNIILMPIFERVGVYENNGNEFLSVKINGKNKLYTTTGKLVPAEDLYSITYDGVYALAKDLRPDFKKFILKNKVNENNIYEVEEVEIPEKVQVAAVEKNVEQTKPTEKIVTVGDKDFVVINDNGVFGLSTVQAEEILPTIYDELSITTDKKPLIIANLGGVISVHNTKGRTIAEQVYNKVNVYQNAKVYTYTKNGNKWILKANGKRLGTLELVNNDYVYTKEKFSFFNLEKVHKLFKNVLGI